MKQTGIHLAITAGGMAAIALVMIFWNPLRGGAGPLALPAGTAFTYQGRLTDGGNPANGAYSFQFALYNADSGGTQVGSTVQRDNVSVTGGVFAVQLDFGAGAFNGEARWLEVSVRQGSSFTVLTPRQALTPAPYALFALNVDTTTVQSRIAASCPPGQAIRLVAANGTVTCDPGAGGITGWQVYTQTTVFTVPAGITHLLVEAWGAGGGGGGGSDDPGGKAGGGGGGGGGGYVRRGVTVSPGSVLQFVVGIGGSGGLTGTTTGGAGQPGGASGIRQGGTALLQATGGEGGGGGTSSAGGSGGAGGGSGDSSPGILVAGSNGTSGTSLFGFNGIPGDGGAAFGPMATGRGGGGGIGRLVDDDEIFPAAVGKPGVGGFLIVQW